MIQDIKFSKESTPYGLHFGSIEFQRPGDMWIVPSTGEIIHVWHEFLIVDNLDGTFTVDLSDELGTSFTVDGETLCRMFTLNDQVVTGLREWAER